MDEFAALYFAESPNYSATATAVKRLSYAKLAHLAQMLNRYASDTDNPLIFGLVRRRGRWPRYELEDYLLSQISTSEEALRVVRRYIQIIRS